MEYVHYLFILCLVLYLPFSRVHIFFLGPKHPHLVDWVLPTSLNQCRYSPFFKLLKSGLLSTEAEGGQKENYKGTATSKRRRCLYTIISADGSFQETEGCSRMQCTCTCSALCILFTSSCFVLRHRIIWEVQRSCPCTFHEGILTGGGERHSFLTSALNGGEWSASFFGRCNSGEKPSITTE